MDYVASKFGNVQASSLFEYKTDPFPKVIVCVATRCSCSFECVTQIQLTIINEKPLCT